MTAAADNNNNNSSRGGRVRVLVKSTAVSAVPVKPGKTYPLSTLDHAMASHRLSLVFYYQAGAGMDREKLKESLSDVLTHYPAMTGRLCHDINKNDDDDDDDNSNSSSKWVVKCNDAGVRMVDARVEGVTLDEWLQSVGSSQEEQELAFWEDMGEDVFLWSPFYIQITEFEDKAFAIGLSCTHMHVDPACAILFIKAWGDIHRRSYIVHPPFFHPPGLIPRSHPNLSTLSAHFLDHKSKKRTDIVNGASRPMVCATFQFSDKSVRSCLSEVSVTAPDATPFDVLASLFWLRIKSACIDRLGSEALTLCVDIRKSMHAPLPHGFYGNALHFSKVEADLGEGGGHVALAMSRHMAGLAEEEYWSSIDWFGSKFEGGSFKPFQMYGPELTCVKLDHVFAYNAIFDKDIGKPVHVACRLGGAEGEGTVIIMPAAEEGMARTVVVMLPEEVLDKVRKDDAILRHGPKIIFGG